MATGGNTRDVELAIGVTTSGTDALDNLRKSVRDLAKSGGDAAPEFERLANELDKISAQQNALTTFTTLRRDVADLAVSMQTAAAEVDKLGAQLPDAAAKTGTFVEAQQRAKQAVSEQAAALAQVQLNLKALRDEFPVGKHNTDEYRASAAALRDEITGLKTALSTSKAEYQQVSAGAKAAAAAQREIGGSYNQAVAGARALSGELGRQNTALAESRDALRDVGLSSTNLVNSQRDIARSFETTRLAIQGEADAFTAARARETQASRDFANAEKALAAAKDFEKTARLVELEKQLATAREKGTADTDKLTASNKALASARSSGDADRIAAQELKIAEARQAVEVSTSRLTALQAAYVVEVRAAVTGETQLAGVEQRRAQQLALTSDVLEASRQRTLQQTIAENDLRDARLKVEAATLAEAKAATQLDLAIADRRPVADAEARLAAQRGLTRLRTDELVAAEKALADRTRDSVDAEQEQAATEGRRAAQINETVAAIDASLVRIAKQTVEENALREARSRNEVATRELADAQARLATSTASRQPVADAERQLTAAREAAAIATRVLEQAEERRAAGIREGLASQQQEIELERQREQVTSGSAERADGLVKAERQLTAAHVAGISATRDTITAEKALDAARATNDLSVIAARERELAETRQRTQAATVERAAAEERLAVEIRNGLAAQQEQIALERERLAAGATAVSSVNAEIGVETRLTAVHSAARQAALDLARANEQLAIARKVGNLVLIAERERDLAEAQVKSTVAVAAAVTAQQVLAEAFRQAAEAEGRSVDSTRRLAEAQQLLAQQFEVETIDRQIAVQNALAAAREKTERVTRQLAEAQQLLDAQTSIDSAIRTEAAERGVAEARAKSEIAARQLAAANTLLAASTDLSKSSQEIAFERELASIREKTAVETRNLATVEGLLAAERDLGDAGRIAQAERTVVDVREKLEKSTRELASAEATLVAGVRALIPVQTAATIAERERASQALKTAAAVREAGLAAKAALEGAFSTAGIRSAEAIQLELIAIDQALNRIARDSRTTGADFDRAFVASRSRVEALKAELNGLPATVKAATVQTNFLGDAIRQASIYFSAFTVGKEFIDANAQLETLRRSLTIVTGSAASAAAQIDFLRKTAADSGVAVSSITGAYNRFAASALAAGIDLQTVNRTFGDVTKAAGLLGLSSDEVGGALNALGQIASKGKVSMEELGQQLGDRLPAVLATTAKGLNVTTAELSKLIQNGEILGDSNFFNAFARGIEETFTKGQGRVEGLNASIARLKNSVNELFTKLGDAGVASGLADAFTLVAKGVGSITDPALAAGKSLGTMTAATVDLTTSLIQLDAKTATAAIDRFKQAVIDSATEMRKASPQFARYFDPFRLGAVDAIKSIKSVEEAQRLLVAAQLPQGPLLDQLWNRLIVGSSGAGKAIDDLRARLLELQAAELVASGTSNQAAQAAGDLGRGISGAANEAAIASSQYVRITADYDKLIEQSDKAGQATVKLSQAKKEETAATLALIQLGGNEIEIRRAGVAAVVANAEALRAVADAKSLEAGLRQAEIIELRVEAAAHGGVTEEVKKQLLAKQLLADSASADAEKARQAVAAIEAEVVARGLLKDTYGDQSAQLAELTKSQDFYANKLAILQSMQDRGIEVTKELTETQKQYVAAEARVKDALGDTIVALDIKNQKLKNSSDIQVATLTVEQQSLQAQIAIAQSYGQGNIALDLQIRLKQNEIEIIRAKIKATEIEANGTIAMAEAKRAELLVTDPLNKAKLQEIDNSINAARVKLLEAKASGANVEVLLRQIEVLRTGAGQQQNYGNAAKGASGAVRDFGSANEGARKSLDGIAGNLITGIHLFEDYGAAAKKSAADLKALGDLATDFVNSANKSLSDKLVSGTIGKDDLALATTALNQAKANAAAISSIHGATLQDIQQAQKILGDAQRAFDAAKAASIPILTPQQIKDQEAARLAAFKSQTPTTKADSSNLVIAQSTLEVQKAQIDAQLQIAKAQGDTTAATNLEITAKQIEIKQLQTKIDLTNKSADATIAAAQAKIFELARTNDLTAEQNKQLQDQITAAKAQKIETGVTAVQIDALQKQITALQQGTKPAPAPSSATTTTTTTAGTGTSSTVSAPTATQPAPQTVVPSSIDEALATFGLKGQAELQAAADALSKSWELIANNASVSLDDQRIAFEKWSEAVIAANKGVETAAVTAARATLQAQESLLTVPKPPTFTPTAAPAPYFSGSGVAALPNPVPAPGAPVPTPRQPVSLTGIPPAPSPYATVNITLNGVSTPIQVASTGDADNLVSFLSQLQQAARSAGVPIGI